MERVAAALLAGSPRPAGLPRRRTSSSFLGKKGAHQNAGVGYDWAGEPPDSPLSTRGRARHTSGLSHPQAAPGRALGRKPRRGPSRRRGDVRGWQRRVPEIRAPGIFSPHKHLPRENMLWGKKRNCGGGELHKSHAWHQRAMSPSGPSHAVPTPQASDWLPGPRSWIRAGGFPGTAQEAACAAGPGSPEEGP